MDYKTPGVYIVEKNAFPGSVVAVETAIPAFIGYTEKAEKNGKSLLKIPTRITSLAEYVSLFGKEFPAKFTLADDAPKKEEAAETTMESPSQPIATADDSSRKIMLRGKARKLDAQKDTVSYFYNGIRFFFANGGSDCYIVSVGLYGEDGINFKKEEVLPAFKSLEKEMEPTMIVVPEAAAHPDICYDIYTNALAHCKYMQSRITILDVPKQTAKNEDKLIGDFRTNVGANHLNYGAAYHPWLKTSVVQPGEINFENLSEYATQLADLFKAEDSKTSEAAIEAKMVNEALVKYRDLKSEEGKPPRPNETDKINLHQALKAISPTYGVLMEEMRSMLNELPPSPAMAGIYTMVDNSRGVWKAPANVSVNQVNAPLVNITNKDQELLNVDATTGKSINVIRTFPGVGTLVWGGRTLDGNSQDWRYINVRRTMIMLEQSIKLACRAYVFEPNDSSTWITVKSMITNFLTNNWKQGALAGAVPEQAFDVQVGLGSTMTGNDILDGKMLVSVKVALVRPAEFIEITFMQQMQQS